MANKGWVDIRVKVSNDNAHYTAFFEHLGIYLSQESDELGAYVEEAKKAFNQPVDRVDVTCKMKDI